MNMSFYGQKYEEEKGSGTPASLQVTKHDIVDWGFLAPYLMKNPYLMKLHCLPPLLFQILSEPLPPFFLLPCSFDVTGDHTTSDILFFT